jgi:hypothetical protein
VLNVMRKTGHGGIILVDIFSSSFSKIAVRGKTPQASRALTETKIEKRTLKEVFVAASAEEISGKYQRLCYCDVF